MCVGGIIVISGSAEMGGSVGVGRSLAAFGRVVSAGGGSSQARIASGECGRTASAI